MHRPLVVPAFLLGVGVGGFVSALPARVAAASTASAMRASAAGRVFDIRTYRVAKV